MTYISDRLIELFKEKKDPMFKSDIVDEQHKLLRSEWEAKKDTLPKSEIEKIEASMLELEFESNIIIDKILEVGDKMKILALAEEFYTRLRTEIFETGEIEHLHITMASKVEEFKGLVNHDFYEDNSAPHKVAKEFITIVNHYGLLVFNEEEVTPEDILNPSESLTISLNFNKLL